MTEEQKEQAQQGLLWFVDISVYGPDGEPYTDLGGKKAAIYVNLGSDWQGDTMDFMYVSENGTEFPIDSEDVTMTVNGNEYNLSKVYLEHFSPYAMLAKFNSDSDNRHVPSSDFANLPQTGEQIWYVVILSGFAALAFMGARAMQRRREKDQLHTH